MFKTVTYVKEATPDTYQHACAKMLNLTLSAHMYKYSMIATVLYVEVNLLWKWFGMIDNSEKFLNFSI